MILDKEGDRRPRRRDLFGCNALVVLVGWRGWGGGGELGCESESKSRFLKTKIYMMASLSARLSILVLKIRRDVERSRGRRVGERGFSVVVGVFMCGERLDVSLGL